MTFNTAVYHDDVVRRAQADAADTVTCPHCPTLVARKRINDHISAHHADIVLSDDERDLLRNRERVIEDGLEGLARLAQALADVRDLKLYRENYPTFEAYCVGRWEKSRSWGNFHARAATIIAFLSPFVDSDELPVREAQTRALSSKDIPEGFVVNVWQLAVQTTEHNDPAEVTAHHIKRIGKIVKEAKVTGGYVDIGNGESEPVTPLSFKAAVLTDEVESRLRQLEHINRKRQPVLKSQTRNAWIGKSGDFVKVELVLPEDTDTAALLEALTAGKLIYANLYTEKDAS